MGREFESRRPDLGNQRVSSIELLARFSFERSGNRIGNRILAFLAPDSFSCSTSQDVEKNLSLSPLLHR